MTSLQTAMTIIWVAIILGGIFWLGEQFHSGWQAIGAVLATLAIYGGAGALLYFTAKALVGF